MSAPRTIDERLDALDERLGAVEADFEKLCALLGTRPSGWIPSGPTTHLRVVE